MEYILAAVAITLGAFASIPQIVKACLSHKTEDLDVKSIALRIAAALTWAVWSIVTRDMTILYSAIANLVVECILLVCKCIW